MINIKPFELSLYEPAFRTSVPVYAEYPHLIVDSTSDNLAKILKLIGATCGMLGETFLFDSENKPVLGNENHEFIKEFTLWKLPRNQKYIHDTFYGWRGDLMVTLIDADIPSSNLTQLYNHLDGEYSRDILELHKYIKLMKWAIVPLQNSCSEHEYMMLFMSKEDLENVHDIAVTLSERNVRLFELVNSTLKCNT